TNIHNNTCGCSEVGETISRINNSGKKIAFACVQCQSSDTGKVRKTDLHNDTWICGCSEVGETISRINDSGLRVGCVQRQSSDTSKVRKADFHNNTCKSSEVGETISGINNSGNQEVFPLVQRQSPDTCECFRFRDYSESCCES